MFKRSIVVLNENDEFEDLNIYIEKRKKQMHSKLLKEKKKHLKTKEHLELKLRIQKEEEKMKKEQEKQRQTDEGDKENFSENTHHNHKLLNNKFKRLKKRQKIMKMEDKISKKKVSYNAMKNKVLQNEEIPNTFVDQRSNMARKRKILVEHKVKNTEIQEAYNDGWGKATKVVGRDFLMINGEKIFFNESTLNAIIQP